MVVLRWCILSTVMAGLLLVAPYGMAETDRDIDGAINAALADPEVRADMEAECIETFQAEDADWAYLDRAARILAAVGTRNAIEPLAAMLDDPDRTHLIRYALEPMPYPEVDAALREALGKTTGKVRLGIITSLGNRRDAEAVTPLAALIAEDAETATTAILALGRIGTVEAADVLEDALDADDPNQRITAAEASLAAAERLVEASDAERAVALLERLQDDTWPNFVQAGAFSAMLRAEPDRAPERVVDAMESEDEMFRAMAIASIETLEGDAVTDRFLGELEGLSGALQAALLSALADRDEGVPQSVLHDALGNDNVLVRVTAIQALGAQGDASTIEPLCDILEGDPSRQEQQAIVETLRRLDGPGVQEGLIAAMQEGSDAGRIELIEVLSQRGVAEAWDAIHAQIASDAIRPTAIRALGDLAKPDQLPELLDVLASLDDDRGRSEAEEAVTGLIQQISRGHGRIEVTHARYGDLPDGDWAAVTDAVAQRVESGELTVEASNRIFGDPAPNIVKQLRVDYAVNGRSGSETVSENQTLTITAEAVPAEVIEPLRTKLEQTDCPDTTGSLLRILSRMGGPEAYELVVARVDHEDEVIRDAAVRALANWPRVEALDALASIVESPSEPVHRTLALRGAVRLLRTEELSPQDTLSVYDRLIGAAESTNDRRLILSGLSDVAHPDAWRKVHAFLDDDEVQAEAALALEQIEEALPPGSIPHADDDYVAIFDGETIDGWAGEPDHWRVEDGHIIGEVTEDNPLDVNTFLIWEGGEPADFELTFRYRIDSEWANSGVQVRSERFENYRVRGYQPDIATDDWITGIHYEEQGRGILARRGQRVEFDEDGERHETRFADEDDLGEHIHPHDWNHYHVIAEGNRIETRINGHKMHEIIDNAPDARREGVIAFQLHTGPPMTIRFTDIAVKELP